MLEDKLKKGLKITGQYMGDDDSGLEVDQDAMELEDTIDPEKLSINLKVIYLISFCFFLRITNIDSFQIDARTVGSTDNHANTTFSTITISYRW